MSFYGVETGRVERFQADAFIFVLESVFVLVSASSVVFLPVPCGFSSLILGCSFPSSIVFVSRFPQFIWHF